MVIPLVLVLYLFSHFLLNPYDPEWYYIEGESEIFESILFLIAYCAIITEISLWVSRVLNKWIPWDKSAALRAIVQVLALIGLIFIVYFGINLAFLVWIPIDRSNGLALEDKIDLWQSLIISINTAIFISAVHTGYFLIKNWRDSMMKAAELQLKAEKLERIASQAELESLRMQLDPHFLFNNFSTLSELVVEDQAIAIKFIDNLSLVYRYMLSNIRKNVVSLKEELTFVESYFYLIHERMGAKVQLHINIDKELSQQFYVAPISLQLLVENAVKHNRASKECPLVIDIYIDGNFVIVENNIQPLVVSIPSSKVGLSNIDDRYRLLSEAKVIVEQTEVYFKVKLPLLLNRQAK
ncbi:histidine kinase [Myroides sp. BIT-d1]|uniref:Histidine kinase n=2 Tax=Flavobacteriaceae TaxID=49546 RepID=A0A6I3LI44_9FLAO|nr:histidine kinase [Myroides albus]MVX35234.1 histidine kinase [Myroides sp. LoEW2-1]